MLGNLEYQEVNSSNLIWKHFLKSVDGNSAKCKLCPAILKISARSTKGLHTHLRTKHNSINVQVTAPIAAPNIRASPTPSTSASNRAIVNLDDIVIDSAPTQSVLPKKRKITEFFASEKKVPVAERVSRMVM